MPIFMGAAFSPLGVLLCMLTSLVLYLFYRILYAPYHIHKQYSIKGPRPEPFWGSYSDIKKTKINNFIAEGQKKYGSFFGFYIGSRFNVVVCDSSMIEEILVGHSDKLSCGGPYITWSRLIADSLRAPSGLRLASGAQWMSCRYALSTIFSPLKIRQIVPVVDESCARLMQKVAEVAESQTTVDVHKLFVDFTMETIIANAFGERAECQKNEGKGSELTTATTEFITHFLDCMTNEAEKITVLLSHFPRARRLLVYLAGHLAVTRAHKRLREAGCRLVEKRRTLASPPQDMLQLLLEALGSNDDENEGAQPIDKEIVSHAIEFLMLGCETVAAGLSCVAYQLARHATVQAQVHEEIDTFFRKKPKKSLYDASLRMPYLDSVIQETLRLNPPTPVIIRHCEEDIELERHTVPRGADVYIPTFIVHKSPDYWPQPHRFDPSRFTEEENKKREVGIYMPFGAGPHSCVGMKLALTLSKMVIISIMRHYTFVLSPKTEVPLKTAHRLADVPSNGVILIISPRTSTTSSNT